jgi:hypothetical protein
MAPDGLAANTNVVRTVWNCRDGAALAGGKGSAAAASPRPSIPSRYGIPEETPLRIRVPAEAPVRLEVNTSAE